MFNKDAIVSNVLKSIVNYFEILNEENVIFLKTKKSNL